MIPNDTLSYVPGKSGHLDNLDSLAGPKVPIIHRFHCNSKTWYNSKTRYNYPIKCYRWGTTTRLIVIPWLDPLILPHTGIQHWFILPLCVIISAMCVGCDCDAEGTVSGTVCNRTSGQCVCKDHVTGRRCDQCESGYWNLTSSGCISCNCYSIGSIELSCDQVSLK